MPRGPMGLDFRRFFFDRKAVTQGMDRARIAGLSKFGSFVRRGDKSSLKYKAGKSAAGTPPHVHTSAHFSRTKKVKGVPTKQAASPLRELIFFGYDPSSRSVVIGPVAFKSRVGTGKVPRVVEHGGVGAYVSKGGKLKQAVYKPRPHTGPAFRKELPKLAAMLAGRFKK